MNTNVIEIVVIGASAGGLETLTQFLREIPTIIPPMVIVQHLSKNTEDVFAEVLMSTTSKRVQIIQDKMPIHPGKIYLAPSSYHLLVDFDRKFVLDAGERVSHALPSIDVFFESCAEVFNERCLGIILTGALHDGAKGMAKIKKYLGITAVQSPETALVNSMPQSAINQCKIDFKGDIIALAQFVKESTEKAYVH